MRRKILAGALAGPAALVLMAAPAMAAPAGAGSAPPAVTGTIAGYQANFPGSGTVRVTQNVPSVTAQFTTANIFSEVTFAGAPAATLTYDSSDNRLLLRAQVGSNSTAQTMTLHAGDSVTTSLTASGSTWSASISDSTTGTSITATGTLSSTPRSVTIGAFQGTSPQLNLPIPTFTPITYTSATVAGRALGSAPGLTQLVMVDSAGAQMVTTGALSSDGTSFTLTFVQEGP